jgi:predicted ArsR family transcriptional regulator
MAAETSVDTMNWMNGMRGSPSFAFSLAVKGSGFTAKEHIEDKEGALSIAFLGPLAVTGKQVLRVPTSGYCQRSREDTRAMKANADSSCRVVSLWLRV